LAEKQSFDGKYEILRTISQPRTSSPTRAHGIIVKEDIIKEKILIYKECIEWLWQAKVLFKLSKL